MPVQLSQRGNGNVSNIMPRVPKAILEAGLLPDEDSVIDLSMAENWMIRDEVMAIEKAAAMEALNNDHFSFPKGFWGDWGVLRELAGFFNKYFNPRVPVTESHIALAPGAAGCIDAVMFNICDPHDGVLIPIPYWNGYDSFCRMRADVVPIPVPTPDLKDPSSFLSELSAALSNATRPVKALVLTNPHNPLGRCFTKAQLEACLRFCEEHDLHFVCDEVFGPLTFENPDLPDEKFVSVLELDPAALGADPARVHMIWSPSKVFALSGVRLGCTVIQANATLRNGQALAAFSNVSILSSILTTALLASPKLPHIMERNAAGHAASYATLTTWLRGLGIPYMPCNAAPFLMVNIAPDAKSWDDEEKVVRELGDKGVWVSSGRGQHMPESTMGWARITFALEPKKIEEAMTRMAGVLKKETA